METVHRLLCHVPSPHILSIIWIFNKKINSTVIPLAQSDITDYLSNIQKKRRRTRKELLVCLAPNWFLLSLISLNFLSPNLSICFPFTMQCTSLCTPSPRRLATVLWFDPSSFTAHRDPSYFVFLPLPTSIRSGHLILPRNLSTLLQFRPETW